MQHKKIRGFIIGIEPHKELDRSISVFSQEHGRIYVIGKGVKKITSQRNCHLDLLNLVKMELEQTGADACAKKYLREIATENAFLKIKKHPQRFAAACLIASFIKSFLPMESPQKSLFNLVERSFSALNSGAPAQAVLFSFFAKTMRALGYLPETMPRQKLRPVLVKTLAQIDPAFSLKARRTLEIFSKLESSRSS